jgi:hypothetical protein
MAEPLKNSFGPAIPRRIAQDILRVHAAFPAKAFERDVLDGYGELNLMARGLHIAQGFQVADAQSRAGRKRGIGKNHPPGRANHPETLSG